jgi:hypothetical protein
LNIGPFGNPTQIHHSKTGNVQFFNVLFNKVMKVLKYVRMRQSYYDTQRVSFFIFVEKN